MTHQSPAVVSDLSHVESLVATFERHPFGTLSLILLAALAVVLVFVWKRR